jgi:hypothetical protein
MRRSGIRSFGRELPALNPVDRESRDPPDLPEIAEEIGDDRYIDREELIETAASEYGYDRDRVIDLIERHKRRGDFYFPEDGVVAMT